MERKQNRITCAICFCLLCNFVVLPLEAVQPVSHRLPEGVLPVLGCWFWQEREFEPEGYKEFLDLISEHSPYNLLTTSLRVPLKELTDEEVHSQIRKAALYARERGVPLVMDLDVRLARRAFEAQYPEELQQMLLFQETETKGKDITIEVRSRELSDHYTHRTTPYVALRGSLLRIYSYKRGRDGIDLKTLKEIPVASCHVEASSAVVKVNIPGDATEQGCLLCAAVAFDHLAADVFAPHLLEFQRRILKQYADTPLAGACKDEWGFPPCFDGNPAKDQFWYSRYRAEEYSRITGGRELLADCLLMSKGIQGRERERIAAINAFMEMSWRRNGEAERDYYAAVKEIFGASAVVATHPTWWPYPDSREFMKNGLDWWDARRDWAQTDELTPFGARTALSKIWNSPVWYNMFYSSQKSDYEKSVWSHALAGGRINYHPIYPREGSLLERSRELLCGDLARADLRVRLVYFLTQTPVECPVAVVVGHAGAMNWAGPAYDDVGMEIVNELWRAGYPTDLIPSSEIENGVLLVDEEGWIQYGRQRYTALVLYHPEFSRPVVGEFFQKAKPGKTALYRVGEWTMDFNGNPLDGGRLLPEWMTVCQSNSEAIANVCRILRERRIEAQTPAASTLEGFDSVSISPSTEGQCRLIDGTKIIVAGTRRISGDPIQTTVMVQGREVIWDTEGIAAVRLDRAGKVETLAAGALKRFKTGDFEISLDTPIDLALWKDADGRFHGVVQDYEGAIPDVLTRITTDWSRIVSPLEK